MITLYVGPIICEDCHLNTYKGPDGLIYERWWEEINGSPAPIYIVHVCTAKMPIKVNPGHYDIKG